MSSIDSLRIAPGDNMRQSLFCWLYRGRIKLGWLVATLVPFVVSVKYFGTPATVIIIIPTLSCIPIFGWNKFHLKNPFVGITSQTAILAWELRCLEQSFARPERVRKAKIITGVYGVQVIIGIACIFNSSYPRDSPVAAEIGWTCLTLVNVLVGLLWIKLDEIILRRENSLQLDDPDVARQTTP